MTAAPDPQSEASSIDEEFYHSTAVAGEPFGVLAACEEALRTQDRLKDPVECANIQHRRAMALLWIGFESDKDAYLAEAVAALQRSLEV